MQLTEGPYAGQRPTFSPDGSTIVFDREDRVGLWRVAADNAGAPEDWHTAASPTGHGSQSTDGHCSASATLMAAIRCASWASTATMRCTSFPSIAGLFAKSTSPASTTQCTELDLGPACSPSTSSPTSHHTTDRSAARCFQSSLTNSRGLSNRLALRGALVSPGCPLESHEQVRISARPQPQNHGPAGGLGHPSRTLPKTVRAAGWVFAQLSGPVVYAPRDLNPEPADEEFQISRPGSPTQSGDQGFCPGRCPGSPVESG